MSASDQTRLNQARVDSGLLSETRAISDSGFRPQAPFLPEGSATSTTPRFCQGLKQR